MKRKSTLLTNNGLELECIILTSQVLPNGGEKTVVYCQNRLCEGLLMDDADEYVAEIGVVVEYCSIPELDQQLLNNEISCDSKL